MIKKIIKITLAVIFIAAITTAIIIYNINNKVLFDENSTNGNTPGNIYNGGLFCLYGDTIYFSNQRDDGALYSMDLEFKNVKKLSEDKPRYLNADANYIYYSRYNYTRDSADSSLFKFYNYGLYRIKHDGSKCVLISKGLTGQAALYKNYMYYQSYDKTKGIWLYRIGIDGKEEKLIFEEYVYPASFSSDVMYYAPSSSSKNHNLQSYNVERDISSTILSENVYMPIIKDNYIYYINLDENHNLYRVSLIDLEPEPLVKDFVSTFNISDNGHMLYYQIDGGENNRLAVLNINTGVQNTLIDGNYKNIHVINKYIFFSDFNEITTYMYDSETGVVNKFIAPIIEK